MPDKKLTDVTDNNVGKMTDSEIIKALEEWRKEIIADYQRLQLLDAPMDCFEESHADTVTKLSNALDLINRLQAEKEELVGNIDKLKAELFDKTEQLNVELQAMRGAANSYKAENERLKKGGKQM